MTANTQLKSLTPGFKEKAMTRHYISTFACIAVLLLTGACKQMSTKGDGQKGFISIDVSKLEPGTKASGNETDSFPVIIRDMEGNAINSYDSFADVPEKITLDVGEYIIEAHTPGSLKKQMAAPFYKGDEKIQILSSVTSEANVTCTMQNSKISVIYNDEFKATFKSWDITLEDGKDIIHFSEKDNQNSKNVVYWLFEEGTKIVTLNFVGTTVSGSKISLRREYTKEMATERYDNDDEHFSGGDAIEFSFKPVESTTGNVTGIEINVYITFDEDVDEVDVDVTDKPSEKPESGPGDNPGENPGDVASDAITLKMPASLTVTDDTDPALGATYMKADNGLKSIMVTVTSTNDEMVETLNGVADEYEGVDLIKGCEVVGNNNLVEFLAGVGKTITVPAKGDVEYTFQVGEFFLFLGILPGQHTFTMIVTDMNGNTKSGAFTITIPE